MTQRDKNIVRELARRYMELANDEKQQKMNRRFRDTNDLKLVRPPVLIDEIPWYQMNINDELTCLCENPDARHLEEILRKNIYRRKYFCADTIFEPFLRVTMSYDSSGVGLLPQEEILRTDNSNNIVSHCYEDVLENEENLELIKIPTFTPRPDKDEYAVSIYTELLGDTMPVKLCGVGYMYNAPWDRIVRYRGMEPILFDFYDRPEYLHKIRQRFSDIMLAEMNFIESHINVDSTNPNLHCTPASISGLSDYGLKATWLRTMAQGFSEISPDMQQEFDIDYTMKLCERFAYTYYGCCEPLDKKLDVICKIPNLRKIGVSPWANEEVMAERLGAKYVYSRKPNPANVAISTDPAVIRKETEETVKLCQKYSCPVEFVLKDISTVSNKPENLIVWSKTVSDVLDQYYGK